VEIGSQDDPAFMDQICSKYPPTIVIDDGSHRWDHMIFTFERVFPHVLPGGFYIIEDMSVCFGEWAVKFKGAATTSPADYFLSIANQKLRGTPDKEKDSGMAKYAFAHTENLSFFKHGVALRKKATPNLEYALTRFKETLSKKTDHALSFFNHAVFLMKNNMIKEAEEAVRKAIQLDPNAPLFHRKLSEVLQKQGNLPEAIKSAQKAVSLKDTNAEFRNHLAALHAANGNLPKAEESAQEAVRLSPQAPRFLRHLSTILEKQGKLDQAINAAQEAVTLSGNAREYIAHLEALTRKSQPPKA
jgi:Flp pilus assembly protein TadD